MTEKQDTKADKDVKTPEPAPEETPEPAPEETVEPKAQQTTAVVDDVERVTDFAYDPTWEPAPVDPDEEAVARHEEFLAAREAEKEARKGGRK